MRKFYLALLLLLSFGSIGYGQQMYVHWTRFIGGELNDAIHSSIQTTDSSIVFVGHSRNYDGTGDIPANSFDSVYSNLIVGKLDSNQQISWLKVYGGSREDGGGTLLELSDGGFMVMSYTSSNDGDVSSNHGLGDIWLLRLDSLGNLLWEKTYGSSLSEGGKSICQTSDGGFIFVASTNGNDGDVPPPYVPGGFSTDWVVMKIDSAGSVQWSKIVGGTGEEYTGFIFEANNGYYVAGGSASHDHDCNDASWQQGQPTGQDYYLIKLDTAGAVLWNRSYGGSGGESVTSAIWDDRDSTILLLGESNSHDFMVNNQLGSNAIWLMKTDKEGNFIWGSSLIDSLNYYSSLRSFNVIKDHFSGYAVAGTIQPPSQSYIGLSDVILYITDSTGSRTGEKLLGGTMYEFGPGNVITYRGGYALAASSESVEFVNGTQIQTNHSNLADAFLAFVSSDLPVSVKDGHHNNILKIYPNPATGLARITLPTNSSGVLAVFDSAGNKMWASETKGDYLDLAISGWPKGIYVIEWIGDYTKYTGKIIYQ